MTRPARIPRAVPGRANRPDPRRDRRHLAFVRSLGCLACAREGRSEAAHIRSGTDGGTGLKPNDRFTVPLCGGLDGCHADQHRRGELDFWSELGIDPLSVAEALHRVSGDRAKADRVLYRAWQSMELKRQDARHG